MHIILVLVAHEMSNLQRVLSEVLEQERVGEIHHIVHPSQLYHHISLNEIITGVQACGKTLFLALRINQIEVQTHTTPRVPEQLISLVTMVEQSNPLEIS